MGKKVREYKSGDFIFAKVKGYPAWPARVQRPNGKKYFVYFYGTGETANLPPNMIFDYAENKDKFLTKTVKRRDFNDGVKQIEYDFANNVPLEEVIGVPLELAAEAPGNDTADDSAIDATMDESAADETANDTAVDDPNVTQTDAGVEDSDDAGALVIDEGKTPKGKKANAAAVKAKETPKPKEPKTPRGKAKKDEPKDNKEEEKTDEELVSRSGRKIRPKRYIDEQTEDNATLPSPAAKKRRGASPVPEKEKTDAPKEKEKDAGKNEKSVAQYNVVRQSELEGLKEAFKPADEDKENILIAYLPSGAYAGIRLFQSRPRSFKNEATRLQWDKQCARNALTLKMQLEREHITPQSVQAQLVMDLNLTDEEKATLDKERETEEKKSRVNFLKTEMKLIELDAKIKTCLCLEKADTDLCLKLLDELLALEVKPLMLLKHPTCLETVKRMRAYVGNTPSWDLSETDALTFSKQAHKIRKKADLLYKNMKEHFQTPEGLSFWEYFSERVLMFKKVTASLNAGELLELVHEPAELSQPSALTMKAAIDQANNSVPPLPDSDIEDEDDKQAKKKPTPAKSKKPAAPQTTTPTKSKRTRGKKDDESTELSADGQKPDQNAEPTEKVAEENGAEAETEKGKEGVEEASKDTAPDSENTAKDATEDVEMAEPEKTTETQESTTEATEKETDKPPEEDSEQKNKQNKSDKTNKESDKEKTPKKDKKAKEDKNEHKLKENSTKEDDTAKESEKKDKKSSKDSGKNGKESVKEKDDKSDEKSDSKDEKSDDKDSGEPRAKRARETKKTEPPPPKSLPKRKSKV